LLLEAKESRLKGDPPSKSSPARVGQFMPRYSRRRNARHSDAFAVSIGIDQPQIEKAPLISGALLPLLRLVSSSLQLFSPGCHALLREPWPLQSRDALRDEGALGLCVRGGPRFRDFHCHAVSTPRDDDGRRDRGVPQPTLFTCLSSAFSWKELRQLEVALSISDRLG
jgi:hypothetical protein